MIASKPMPGDASRRVLLVVEDPALGELLSDVLAEAGHVVQLAADDAAATATLADDPFDVAIVDLDTRARDGSRLLERIRATAPSTLIVALLPCGGLPPAKTLPAYHLAIEKPARIRTVLLAINAGPTTGSR